MSGRRVFLDVGGHLGESLAVAMEPRWRFDRVWSFEPTMVGVAALRRMADERVTVVPAGLWSTETEMDIHDPGTLHASVDSVAARTGGVERCRFLDAGAWLADHIDREDQVWMKMNIEASEIEVLERLLETGEIAKIDHLVVHFDVEKVGRGEEAVPMRRRLDAAGVPWREEHEVMFGRDRATKTATWLSWTEGDQWGFRRRRFAHRARRGVFLVRRALRAERSRT